MLINKLRVPILKYLNVLKKNVGLLGHNFDNVDRLLLDNKSFLCFFI